MAIDEELSNSALHVAYEVGALASSLALLAAEQGKGEQANGELRNAQVEAYMVHGRNVGAFLLEPVENAYPTDIVRTRWHDWSEQPDPADWPIFKKHADKWVMHLTDERSATAPANDWDAGEFAIPLLRLLLEWCGPERFDEKQGLFAIRHAAWSGLERLKVKPTGGGTLSTMTAST